MPANYAVDSSSGNELFAEGYEFLEEELDENYEPTGDEIEEYAKYLGMDLQEDRHLFYIAKEGLKAPLPGSWKPCQRYKNGDIWYYNFDTKEMQKDHPCDDYYRKYYLNEKTLAVKKKEEAVIKKQIKEQQK